MNKNKRIRDKTMMTPKTVLIVDDSRLSRMIIKALIMEKHPDWAVLEASNSEQTISLMKAIEEPDLITLDVNMPGMDGLSLAVLIRETWASVPVVIMTANVQESVSKKCSELKIGFVEKPVNADSVAKALTFLE
jgi:two-component system chemotaxis response regulator CheY